MSRIIGISFFALLLYGCVDDPVEPGNGVPPPPPIGEMKTTFSEDWDNWDYAIRDSTTVQVSVDTDFSEDWDNWGFSGGGVSGDISTSFSEDWDNWKLSNGNYTITMKTTFSEDWDNWDIDDNANDFHCDLRTSFSEDWDNWEASDSDTGAELDIETDFSDDFDNWDVDGEWPVSYPLEYKIAIMFIPTVVNVLRIQGLIP